MDISTFCQAEAGVFDNIREMSQYLDDCGDYKYCFIDELVKVVALELNVKLNYSREGNKGESNHDKEGK
jgi:hypothetical protein